MKILLGVTGGVAAYKAAELVRELQRRGCTVQVALTESAAQFVTSLTFAALSGSPVLTSLWTPTVALEVDAHTAADEAFGIEHIDVAQRIDALVIAPATANTLARLAHGMADDVITTVALATRAPVLVAPAMNVNMWQHPATQANLQMLRARGVQVVEPGSGYLACGMTGGGRLAEPAAIADAVVAMLAAHSHTSQSQDLAGETILITAGGTREPLDPVRYLGNRSSGRMGYALAEAAMDRGARVHLVSASQLPAPAGCSVINVDTAEQMRAAVMAQLSQATVVIGAAAVADFRPVAAAQQKLKRREGLRLELEPTADIIREAARLAHSAGQGSPLVIAFAAETENVLANARRKLQEKGVDAIVANDVSHPELGFDSERNAGTFVAASTETPLPESSKRQMAERILDCIITLKAERGAVAAQEGSARAFSQR